MTSVEEAADCIEATNTPQTAAFKTRVAADLRQGQIDLLGLDSVERDARRQLQAVRIARKALTETASGPGRVGASGHLVDHGAGR